LAQQTRHLLLMTATPHNGKEEDFQLFLSLLDSDRFYGKFRDGVHKVDTSDLMRRMVKEEMVKFDGTPLFPERRAYTVNYTLSDLEAALYESVTHYVQTEMGKADQLDGARKGSVGFALTALQRRLASSPEAIYQSLKRRKERLEAAAREKLGIRGQQVLARLWPTCPRMMTTSSSEEQETLEETLVDQATAALTIVELEAEIIILQGLEQQAKAVVSSGQDRKWDELSRLLQNDPDMRDAGGRQRKLIIFSEHRDTLNYLHQRIAGVLGNPDAIVTIHGGTHRDERRRVQASVPLRPGRARPGRDGCRGRRREPPERQPDGQLRPAVEPEPPGAAVRSHPPHRPDRGLPPVEPGRQGDPRGRGLPSAARRSLKSRARRSKGRVFDILGEVFEEIQPQGTAPAGHPLRRPAGSA
jgi:hypothetical protein